jgi:hypothetical protein
MARVDLPKQSSIKNSRKLLDQVGTIIEDLRRFIIENFEIDEII